MGYIIFGGGICQRKIIFRDPLYAEGVFEEQQAMDMNNKYGHWVINYQQRADDITNKVSEWLPIMHWRCILKVQKKEIHKQQ